jgi:hypothetical protein
LYEDDDDDEEISHHDSDPDCACDKCCIQFGIDIGGPLSHHPSEGEDCPCDLCEQGLVELDFDDWEDRFELDQNYVG